MSEEVFHPPVDTVSTLQVLQALADPARLAMVRSLGHISGVSCTVVQEDAGLKLSRSTLSHHLRTLREAGIIRIQIQGSHRKLSLRRDDLEGRFPGLLDSVLKAP